MSELEYASSNHAPNEDLEGWTSLYSWSRSGECVIPADVCAVASMERTGRHFLGANDDYYKVFYFLDSSYYPGGEARVAVLRKPIDYLSLLDRDHPIVSQIHAETMYIQGQFMSSNCAIMTAALYALHLFELDIQYSRQVLGELGFGSIIIATDLVYLVEGFTRWIPLWRRNGWRTAEDKAVRNRDLWEKLLQSAHKV